MKDSTAKTIVSTFKPRPNIVNSVLGRFLYACGKVKNAIF